ncbi:Na/Pi cotransporter family protein [Bradyrhizobium sp. AUGA SZCCT0431]|nr:Na/Pi cotransporter family protein [Bradyrhizobium sp. AUGA SZCCT0431]
MAMLLMWGLRMVRTGVTRAFGARLRHALAVSTRNRVMAFVTGLLATLALQSSTATSVLTTSFASRAYVTTAMAMAIMLGANVGTAVAAKILSWEIHWLSSLLILIGVSIFSLSSTSRPKAIGRAFIGLGLMLLALHLIGAASEPMRKSPVIGALLSVLNQAPIVGFFLSGIMTLATASSLPVIFLIISLATGGTIDSELTLYLVFGVNVGGAMVPLLAISSGPVAKRVPLGNLALRLAGFIAIVPFAGPVAAQLQSFAGNGASFVMDCHLLINVVLAAAFLPFVGTLGNVLDRALPEPTAAEHGPRYLDESCLDNPGLALACAARETMRVGDQIDAMLSTSLRALQLNDIKLCGAIGKMDDEVDDLQEAIKLYLAKLGREEPVDEKDAQRSTEIISFAINLEHIGDIIDKSLRELAEKKIKHQAAFSKEGSEEMESLFARTRENLRIAQSILISQNIELARRLVSEKVHIRRFEQSSAENHLQRLRDRRIESLQTSTIHLDIMRDLKRINSHIISVAYPALELAGELRESRLKGLEDADDKALLTADTPTFR